MNTLADLRPKLKRDSVFLQTPEGIFLKNDDIAFSIKGKSIYRWMSVIAPHMTGQHTLKELCEGLTSEQRTMIERLVNSLIEKGVVKNHVPESPELLSAAQRTAFKMQIEFIDHYVEQPLKRFKTFRESRLLLLGAGQALNFLARSLMRNGLKHITLAPMDDLRPYRTLLEAESASLLQQDVVSEISFVDFQQIDMQTQLTSYDLLIYCADEAAPRRILELQRSCINQKQKFLSALISTDSLIIGPLCRPDEGPCWLCGQMRLAAGEPNVRNNAFWSALALDLPMTTTSPALHAQTSITSALLHRMGSTLAFEIFKYLTQPFPAETESGMLIQDLQTLEARHAHVLQHPLCPVCTDLTPADIYEQLVELASAKRDTTYHLADHFQEQIALFLDPQTGIFTEFVDESFEQLPLKVSRLKGRHAQAVVSSTFEVTAYSTEHVFAARCTALREGLNMYAQHVLDERALLYSSFDALKQNARKGVSAAMLANWSGCHLLSTEDITAWLPAISLLQQDVCYVPAGAVFPYSSLNSGGVFARSLAGTGVGTSFSELCAVGLHSAWGYEVIRQVIQGENVLAPLDLMQVEEASSHLTFLVRNARHFEQSLIVLEVIHDAPLHVLIACAIDKQEKSLVAIGVGLSGPEAAAHAFQELVGQLQLSQKPASFTAGARPFFPPFSPYTAQILAENDASRFNEVWQLEQLKPFLQAAGRDLLFVNTTPLDFWKQGIWHAGKVLITEPAYRTAE